MHKTNSTQPGDAGLTIYRAGDTLPPSGIELLGEEAARAWGGGDASSSAAQAGKAGENVSWVCVLSLNDSGVAIAGALLKFEPVTTQGQTQRVASLRQLIVSPAARGLGLAKKLISASLHLASEHHCTRLRTTAGWGCHDHLAMYDRMQFVKLIGEAPYLMHKTVY
jgi:GNAT superfamily N-acetyltransferase